MKNGMRINVVSSGVAEDSPEFFDAFQGHTPVTMDRVVTAFRKSVPGAASGEVTEVW